MRCWRCIVVCVLVDVRLSVFEFNKKECEMQKKLLFTFEPPPDGFEYAGEIRIPNDGEWFLGNSGINAILCSSTTSHHPSIILRPLQWVPRVGDFYYIWRDGEVCQHRLSEGYHLYDPTWWQTEEQAEAYGKAYDKVCSKIKFRLAKKIQRDLRSTHKNQLFDEFGIKIDCDSPFTPQEISSAPLDGTDILVWSDKHVWETAFWNEGAWCGAHHSSTQLYELSGVTHWLPMPPDPRLA